MSIGIAIDRLRTRALNAVQVLLLPRLTISYAVDPALSKVVGSCFWPGEVYTFTPGKIIGYYPSSVRKCAMSEMLLVQVRTTTHRAGSSVTWALLDFSLFLVLELT